MSEQAWIDRIEPEPMGPCEGCGAPGVVMDESLAYLCRECAEGCRVSSAGENIQ